MLAPPNIATCRSVSVYEGALTVGRKYAVLAASEDNVQIQDDAGQTRWYPRSCFDLTGADVPIIASIRIDGELPAESPVEVTVELSSGQKRWCWFATPEMLTRVGDLLPGTDVRIHYGRNMLVVSALSRGTIEAALHYLESQDELLEHTFPLGSPGEPPQRT